MNISKSPIRETKEDEIMGKIDEKKDAASTSSSKDESPPRKLRSGNAIRRRGSTGSVVSSTSNKEADSDNTGRSSPKTTKTITATINDSKADNKTSATTSSDTNALAAVVTSETITANSASVAKSKSTTKTINDKGKDVPAKASKPIKKPWKKPDGMPKRPLSAYNLYFQQQRNSLVGDDGTNDDAESDDKDNKIRTKDGKEGTKRKHRKSHGKVGFVEMARLIGERWKKLPDSEKKSFEERASKEKKRYKGEIEVWKKSEAAANIKRKAAAAALKDSMMDIEEEKEESQCAVPSRNFHSHADDIDAGTLTTLSMTTAGGEPTKEEDAEKQAIEEGKIGRMDDKKRHALSSSPRSETAAFLLDISRDKRPVDPAAATVTASNSHAEDSTGMDNIGAIGEGRFAGLAGGGFAGGVGGNISSPFRSGLSGVGAGIRAAAAADLGLLGGGGGSSAGLGLGSSSIGSLFSRSSAGLGGLGGAGAGNLFSSSSGSSFSNQMGMTRTERIFRLRELYRMHLAEAAALRTELTRELTLNGIPSSYSAELLEAERARADLLAMEASQRSSMFDARQHASSTLFQASQFNRQGLNFNTQNPLVAAEDHMLEIERQTALLQAQRAALLEQQQHLQEKELASLSEDRLGQNESEMLQRRESRQSV